MRISDWSSDVCSSDLQEPGDDAEQRRHRDAPDPQPDAGADAFHRHADHASGEQAAHHKAHAVGRLVEIATRGGRKHPGETPLVKPWLYGDEHAEDRKSTRLNSSH